jgi:hypothetical protein
MSGFLVGDMWTLFDLTGGGSITSTVALDYSSLTLGPGLIGDFNEANGIFSIVAIPEPSRALLLLIGLSTTLVRRRRTASSAVNQTSSPAAEGGTSL